jgi:hypothetical protein
MMWVQIGTSKQMVNLDSGSKIYVDYFPEWKNHAVKFTNGTNTHVLKAGSERLCDIYFGWLFGSVFRRVSDNTDEYEFWR